MIDEKDREILALLQKDGRATYGEIGSSVGLAASSVHDRVRKMEARGVIVGFGPRLDPAKLGLGLTAFVSLLTNKSCSTVASQLQGWPEIVEYHSVAGEECALLKVRVADTMGLENVLERLRAMPEVERTRSTIVLRSRWEEGDHPTTQLYSEAV